MLTKEIIKQLPNVQVVSTVSQEEDEAEWLSARTKGIGGSDVGAICGVSPFTSARQIYFSKTGQFEEALKPGAAAAERMHFGHLLEPIVADEFAKRELTADKGRAGWYLCELNATVCMKGNTWMRANVDRLIMDGSNKPVGILECKTTSEYNNEEWESGDILLSYVYQLNWYMYILDIKWGAFACLVGGNKFYTYEVFRNDDLLRDVILPAAENFWFNNVQALKEPELQAVDTVFANSTAKLRRTLKSLLRMKRAITWRPLLWIVRQRSRNSQPLWKKLRTALRTALRTTRSAIVVAIR